MPTLANLAHRDGGVAGRGNLVGRRPFIVDRRLPVWCSMGCVVVHGGN
jgi:hypothetical protein